MDIVGLAGLVGVVTCAAADDGASPPRSERETPFTWWAAATVFVCLLAQLRWPWLLFLLRRDGAAIHAGQVYRILTSLFVQDAWLAGGAFNLAMMTIVGRVAERRFGHARWTILYLVGGMSTELVALSWQPVGAGNSIAYMSLAGGLLVRRLVRDPSAGRRATAIVGLVLAAGLCARWDIHGAAVMIGAVLAVATGYGLRRRPDPSDGAARS